MNSIKLKGTKRFAFLTPLMVAIVLASCGGSGNKFTVTWVNEDGTVLEVDDNVEYGVTPTYDGDTPRKADDEDNLKYYVFSNWSPEISPVTSNQKYIAQYKVIPETTIKIYVPAQSEVIFSFSYDGTLGKVDWGDDTYNKMTDHTYKATGEMEIKIYGHITSLTIKDNACVQEVQLGNLINSISDSSFKNCESLESVTIPDGIISIGRNAFQNCTNLETVKIPDTVTSIGNYAFEGCTALKGITIPRVVNSIGARAFANCPSLTEIKVDRANSTYTSRDSSNKECNAIIKSDAKELIAGCKSTIIPTDGTVTTIGMAAFAGSKIWGEIEFPNTIIAINSSAFEKCDSITKVTIPNTVTTIGGKVFYGCTKMTEVTLPNNLKVISEELFEDCIALTSITIPDTVETIERGAFQNCIALATITMKNPHLKTIGDLAFRSCYSLTELTIPDGVISIGKNAFEDCYTATSVSIPKTVTSIGKSAFSGCISIDSIKIENDNEYYTDYDNNVIVVRETNTLIQGCVNSTIPDGVKIIDDYAFQGCVRLETIEIPNSVETIGAYAFYNCFELKELTTTSANVTTIGEAAFGNCWSIEDIYIPASVTSIGIRAFSNCQAVQTITVDSTNPVYTSGPDDTNAIITNNSLILGCSNTMIPNDVTSIADYAFRGSVGLTSISLPANILSIGSFAFDMCEALEDVYINRTIDPIILGANAFKDCDSLQNIYVPSGLVDLYRSAPGWIQYADKISPITSAI